ncbi:hypothetical protein BJY16_006155 [Actinoplanes octamycinicus]|uniref:Uncharacterized protein n=1 Tax=Actinoplanes octamycinicus TaxID=135948 RepID=A0A7W7MA99_9ACTN|nr:hypothetical protein [Actinoplanes octamycinicus]
MVELRVRWQQSPYDWLPGGRYWHPTHLRIVDGRTNRHETHDPSDSESGPPRAC